MPDDQIPHLLHYCWFGGNALSDTAQDSLKSWGRYASDFEIRKWDETNAPLDDCAFVHDAYKAGKWAFVSDYIRFWALYRFGGIYMDVGSELVKDITPLIQHAPFSAIEAGSLTVNAGLIACCAPGNQMVRTVLETYQRLPFIDSEDYLRAHTVNEVFTTILERHGYCRENTYQVVDEWTIFPSSFFDPLYGVGGFHIKKSTYSVHHSSASWLDPVQQTKQRIQQRVTPYLGHRLGQIIGRVIGEFEHHGVRGIKNLIAVTGNVISRKWNSN